MTIRWGERLRSRLVGAPNPSSLHRPAGGVPGADGPTAAPTWQLALRALAEVSGFDRGLFYDVPRAEAPRPLPGTRVFLRGSGAWRRYLAAREQLDDGDLAVIISLRSLDDRERRLAVDWGNSYANAFPLVEPSDPACDLTDPRGAERRALEGAAAAILRHRGPADEPDVPWTRETPLGEAARRLFGAWIAWPSPGSAAPVDRVSLRPLAAGDTLRDALLAALTARYPQEAFDAAMAELYERERELFGGPVSRARIPFLTRLGMPVPWNPYRVDHAIRRLVNEGRAWVFEDGPDPAFYRGPARPVPERMTDAEFERLIVR